MLSIRSYLAPIGAMVAIVSLFLPWFKGHLTFIGKIVSGTSFPGVFWTVLLGCLATLVVFIYGKIAAKEFIANWTTLGLSFLTLTLTIIFLYSYAQKSSMPGVQIHVRHGIIVMLLGLILANVGSWLCLIKPSGD